MDPLSVTASAVALVTLFLVISQALTAGTRQRLFNTHGWLFGVALYVFLNPAYEQLERMEDQILHQMDEDIEKYRTGYLNECNMAAVAGTIIAQVALTSLALSNLSQTHWVARAAFILSLVSGCLAVFYASLVQRSIGNLRKPSDVRNWLCRRPWEVVNGTYDRDHLVASVAVAALLSSPSIMINFAIGAFLTGIGIYLGFVWMYNLDPLASQQDSRNIFICFIISLGFCGCFYGVPLLFKLILDSISMFRAGNESTAYDGSGPGGPRAPHGRKWPGETTSLESLHSALADVVNAQVDCTAATRRLMLQYERLIDLELQRPEAPGGN